MSDSVARWLAARLEGRSPTPAQERLFSYLRAQPQKASFATITEVAASAGTTAATVTRAAKSLGYGGWPSLQREYRSRFLAALSASEVSETHERHGGNGAEQAISLEQQHMANLRNTVAFSQLRQVAGKMARARTTWVLASGSYSIPARALVHVGIISGYDVRLIGDDSALAANISTTVFGKDDTLVCFSLWKGYRETYEVLRRARRVGQFVSAITDDSTSVVASMADITIVVPSEGAGFFPSLVPSLAIAQAIAAELSLVDRDFSRGSVRRVEQSWDEFNLLRLNSGR